MKHKTEDYKLAAVRHYLEISDSQRNTCIAFGCAQQSLQRWVIRFLAEASIRRHNRLPVSYKITQPQAAYAIEYLLNHQTSSTPELHTAVKEHFPEFNISISHLRDIVRDFNSTRKRTRHGHFPTQRYRRPVNRNQQLRAFYNVTDAHPINRIISIDETSLIPFMFRAYSRCRLGDKCVQVTDENRVFTKHTFVAAITNQRLLGCELYDEGAMTSERMVAFLTRLIRRYRLRGYLFLLDNAGAHRNQSVRDVIATSGNQLLHTVPYNPQTNAVEAWFSQFKWYMSTCRIRTVAAIRRDIETVLSRITPEHYRAYFQYAYRKGEYPQRPRPRGSTHERPPKAYKQP